MLAVVGSTNWDMTFEVLDLPSPGQTLLAKNCLQGLGGKGANQACASAKQKVATRFLTCLGDDPQASLCRKKLADIGVDSQWILTKEGQSTGVAYILVNRKAENQIVVSPGANQALSAKDMSDNNKIFNQVEVALFQMEIPVQTIAYALKEAKSFGCICVLNPAPATVLTADMFSDIDIITPNEGELATLVGRKLSTMQQIRQAGNELVDKGVKVVLVTLGGKGVLVIDERDSVLVPPYIVDAIDTTGAGDCFNGIFAAFIANGKDLTNALLHANAGAAISVTRKGAASSIPSIDEIKKFISFNKLQIERLRPITKRFSEATIRDRD